MSLENRLVNIPNPTTKTSMNLLISCFSLSYFGIRFVQVGLSTCKLFLVFLCVALSACVSQPVLLSDASNDYVEEQVESRNKEISRNALVGKKTNSGLLYRLGPGDLLELSVFRVEDLNRKVRVNGQGEIELPLLGVVDVGGLTLSKAQTLIAQKLQADYLQNPQVVLYIQEYRSQEITVMGAVQKPDVYTVKKTRSIFEMLSLAGGLSKTAGDLVRVKTKQLNENSGEYETIDLVVSLGRLLAGRVEASNFQLRDGDSILIPEAGFVTVEGAVENPGSYKMDGETNVLKAVALAGGIPWTGKQEDIRVIRNQDDELVVLKVNLARVRDSPSSDLVLQDGDVVSVSHSAAKRAVSGFFKTAGQILGYRIN